MKFTLNCFDEKNCVAAILLFFHTVQCAVAVSQCGNYGNLLLRIIDKKIHESNDSTIKKELI